MSLRPERRGPGALRIAFVVDKFPSLSETFVLNQITGLLDRGHEVDIVATKPPDRGVTHPEVLRYGLLRRTQHITMPASRFVRAIRGAGLLAVHAPRHPRLLGALNVVRHGRAAMGFHLLYAAVPFLETYDIVHCQFGTNGEAVGAVLKELGLQRTLVTTFHGYDIRLAERQGPSPYRRLLHHGDCFLAISAYSRARLLDLGVDPAKIVYHPVGLDGRLFRFKIGPADPAGDEIGIVTVARLVSEKAIETAILAVALVLRRQPGLRLRYEIVGDGPERERLARLVAHLGLEGAVHLRGAQPHDSVIEILRRNHIFLLPSRAEVLPVALMEAQAAGLPAVASAVGAMGEIVQDGRSGFLVPAGDEREIAARLQELILDPRLRGEMGRVGRDHVLAHFDVNVLNDRLVEIYRRVLRRPGTVPDLSPDGEGFNAQAAVRAKG